MQFECSEPGKLIKIRLNYYVGDGVIDTIFTLEAIIDPYDLDIRAPRCIGSFNVPHIKPSNSLS